MRVDFEFKQLVRPKPERDEPKGEKKPRQIGSLQEGRWALLTDAFEPSPNTAAGGER